VTEKHIKMGVGMGMVTLLNKLKRTTKDKNVIKVGMDYTPHFSSLDNAGERIHWKGK